MPHVEPPGRQPPRRPPLDHREIPWREPEVWLAEVRAVRAERGKLRDAAIDNGMALGRLWLEGKAHHRPQDQTIQDFAKTAFGVDDPSFLNRCARVWRDRERLPEARLWWETEAVDAGWKPIPSGTGGLDWAAKILKARGREALAPGDRLARRARRRRWARRRGRRPAACGGHRPRRWCRAAPSPWRVAAAAGTAPHPRRRAELLAGHSDLLAWLCPVSLAGARGARQTAKAVSKLR